MTLPPDRAHILTEQRNPRTMDLHTLSVADLVERFNQEDRAVLEALEAARPALTAFIEAAEPRFIADAARAGAVGGGRLIYTGAGTSGRLGVLDASEAPPTFQVEHGRIAGLIAGGDRSLRFSSEGMEDDPDGARLDLEALGIKDTDTVLGIAAGGTTPYVRGSLGIAKELAHGCLTGLLTCTTLRDAEKPPGCDHLIVLPVGPEVLTGSTRMKSGTATKLALNIISTTLMIRSGRVYENLMVDLRATNNKLRDRAARIISTLTDLPREEAFALLDRADGAVKTAILMHKRGVGREEALALLAEHGGRLDRAIEA
jgi:N-acetylmuramic acid 6-phosphate etherase